MPFKKISLGPVTNFVLVYMLFAFIWWAVHLWRENDRLLNAEIRVLELQHRVEQRGANMSELQNTKEYKAVIDRHDRRRRMVLGEGIFFTGCLFFGLWMIHKSVRHEIALARQRRNFMLSITHELKSPIAAIRLAFETIHKRELEREQMLKFCKNGIRDADRLNTLVQDLLLAARLEDNWRPLLEPIVLHTITKEIVAGLRLRYPESNITIQIPPDLPPVQADESGLVAIVQNLLENALKYTSPGTPVVLNAEMRLNKFHLSVSDQGPGIPDSEKKAIFEKFYRVGNEDTRKTSGTGLGLYIVGQVVRAHGGTIAVTDNKPHGAIFTIEL